MTIEQKQTTTGKATLELRHEAWLAIGHALVMSTEADGRLERLVARVAGPRRGEAELFVLYAIDVARGGPTGNDSSADEAIRTAVDALANLMRAAPSLRIIEGGGKPRKRPRKPTKLRLVSEVHNA